MYHCVCVQEEDKTAAAESSHCTCRTEIVQCRGIISIANSAFSISQKRQEAVHLATYL